MQTLGHTKLRDFLAQSGWTCKELAEKAGISKQQLSHLFRGRRRASFLVAVAIEDATHGFVPARSWVESFT